MGDEGRPQVRFSAKLTGWLWAIALKLLCQSWDKRYEGFESIDEKRHEGKKMMLCFWHGKYLPIFALCRWLWIEQRAESACVFTSYSARGQVIAEICRNFGLDCIQIPDRGQKHSYSLMKRALASHTSGVIAVDGPLGPNRRVKQGAIRLASDLNYMLVPASVYTKSKKIVEQRWDKMEIPKPFTTIGLSMGAPIGVPSNISKTQIRTLMNHLFETLENLEASARRLI